VDREDLPQAEDRQRRNTMHDLLIGLAFIGMVIAPALVAAHSGSGEPTDETE
jgi:hypothetical protein